MDKKTLRNYYKNKRDSLSEKELNNLSLKISDLFFDEVLNNGIKYLHTFLPIEGKKEVNTKSIIDRILAFSSKIELVISKCNFSDGSLSHYIYDSGTILEKNNYGVEEPVNGIIVEPRILDLIVVPLLAFDNLGNRVGYGKGFYDRFLNSCREDTLKVGVSLFEACEMIEDTNNDDIPLDICVTPSKIYNFKLAK